MNDYDDMIDAYEDDNGTDSAAQDGIPCWRELQDIVGLRGE